VTISDNDIGPGRLNFMSAYGAAGPVDDIVVVGNRLNGKNMAIDLKAPPARRRTNFSLIGNVSDAPFGSSTAAVKVEGFDGVTIRDNVLPLQRGREMTAVAFTATCDTTVVGNTFANAARDVKSDGYDCGETAPAMAAPASSPPTTSSRTTTPSAKSSPSPTAAVAPAQPSPTVSAHAGAAVSAPAGGGNTVVTTVPSKLAKTSQAGKSDGFDDEASAALPADGRLVDSPQADEGGGPDSAIWVLGIGTLTSLAVLLPLSRSGQKKRPSGR
jgi:hypothetical protein